VAVRLPRSRDLVVALLAILQTGAAYTILDASHPKDRAALLIKDSGAHVLITANDLALEPGSVPGVTVVDLHDRKTAPRSPTKDSAEAASTVDAADVAYVAYTSGSTGRPKGVQVTHSGFANYVSWAAAAYCPEPVLSPLHTSLAFDLAVTSLWVPLVSGGTVLLMPESETLSLARLPSTQRTILLKLTPTHIGLLASTAEPVEESRFTVVIGGEALRYEQVARLREIVPQSEMWNEYGPTEATVGCCVHRVKSPGTDAGPVAIGLPIANTVFRVLDLDGEPVRGDEPGELYIGGAGVALGYRGQPKLTDVAFVRDPASPQGTDRFYRTGDRVRRTKNEEWEFLGRLDDQIKIHGFRVEPAEIELCLRSHPEVGDAIAIMQSGLHAHKPVLVGYVVVQNPENTSLLTRLTQHLRERLPHYMVPALLYPMTDLPLTSNGKIDKKALPWPIDHQAGRHENRNVELPESGTEREVSEIWQEVLDDEEPIERWDDFFTRGGDSVLAIEATALIRQRLGVAIPPGVFFQAENLADLAAQIDQMVQK
jgi:amino acid adenylation domain-containing protein